VATINSMLANNVTAEATARHVRAPRVQCLQSRLHSRAPNAEMGRLMQLNNAMAEISV
jgi:hypothetical protein